MWWSNRWRLMLQELDLALPEPAQAEPLRVKQLDVSPGSIHATVVGPADQECDIQIAIAVWSRAEWQQAEDALSSQALFAAQLLAGELPPQLDETLAAAGVPLLPNRTDAIDFRCSVHGESGSTACLHAMYALQSVGTLVDEDPWLLFRLRGRDQSQLLRHLRHTRTQSQVRVNDQDAGDSQLDTNSHASGFLRSPWEGEREPRPRIVAGDVDLDLHDYWGNRKRLEEFRPSIGRPHVELVLLRRLGFPPFAIGSGETYDALATIYGEVTNRAMQLAYASEREERMGASDREY